jgi:two-component system, cell cycle response regulator DivK
MSTILVVEDHPPNLKLAQLVLEKGGHGVLTASDGQQGIELARSHRPDLIVMDVMMPGMDGLAATRALKADPATAHIKVLALTALAMKGDEQRILEAGCDAYLSKPFEYKALLEAVTNLLPGEG